MRRLIRESDPPAGQLASPVPQYWNPNTEAFEDVLGAHGAPRAILYGPNGQPIGSSNPLPVADSALAQAVAQLATEGKLEEARALLETISQKDFATQTTLSEVLQRLEAIEEQLETGDAKVQLKGQIATNEGGMYVTGNIELLDLTNPVSGEQVTHPSVVKFDFPWNGYRYWMAFTPYDGENTRWENPTIYASNDGVTWEEPPGIINPIDGPPETGYYSDPELVVVGNSLRCYYRQNNRSLFFKESVDGVTWGPRQTCSVAQYMGTPIDPLSPSIVRREDGWYMWTGSYFGWGYRLQSDDGVDWKDPIQYRTNIMSHGRPWHPMVWETSDGLHMVCAVSRLTDDFNRGLQLYYARGNSDGSLWTFDSQPLIPRGGVFNEKVYRSCVVPEGDHVSIYVSGVEVGPKWRIGLVKARMRPVALPSPIEDIPLSHDEVLIDTTLAPGASTPWVTNQSSLLRAKRIVLAVRVGNVQPSNIQMRWGTPFRDRLGRSLGEQNYRNDTLLGGPSGSNYNMIVLTTNGLRLLTQDDGSVPPLLGVDRIRLQLTNTDASREATVRMVLLAY